jgi:chromosome segregation ATPase
MTEEKIKNLELEVETLKIKLENETKQRKKLEDLIVKIERAVEVHELILEKLEKTVPKPITDNVVQSDDEY